MVVTPKALVGAGLYPDESSVIQEAMRILWQEKPQLRIEWAVYQYQTEDISLAKTAAIANISFDQMKQILIERGIQPRLGPETVTEAGEELTALEQALRKQP